MEERHVRLTSSEIAQLWTQFMNDSTSICMLSYFLEKVEDQEIKQILEYSLNISLSHIEKITAFLTKENYAIPHGFKLEEDVDTKAPRLFSDVYILHFVYQMAKIGLLVYSTSLSASIRSDITDYYMDCLTETMNLYKLTKKLLLLKGLFTRPPYIHNNEDVDDVKKQSFLLDVFGEKRPLLAMEISNLFTNLQRNILGAATLTGFSQVAEHKEVKQFLLRGIDIAKKHIKLFGKKLEESNLPVPSTLNSEITLCTDHIFSDKLIMFFTSALNSLSVSYYGTAISQSFRGDLGVMYNRLSMEVQLYSEDGSNIMIKNKWIE